MDKLSNSLPICRNHETISSKLFSNCHKRQRLIITVINILTLFYQISDAQIVFGLKLDTSNVRGTTHAQSLSRDSSRYRNIDARKKNRN